MKNVESRERDKYVIFDRLKCFFREDTGRQRPFCARETCAVIIYKESTNWIRIITL